MRPPIRSLVSLLDEAGPGDRVFNVLLLLGPAVIVLLAILGRTAFTVALVGMYLFAFLGYVTYKGSTRGGA